MIFSLFHHTNSYLLIQRLEAVYYESSSYPVAVSVGKHVCAIVIYEGILTILCSFIDDGSEDEDEDATVLIPCSMCMKRGQSVIECCKCLRGFHIHGAKSWESSQ